jgi:hypothetical protein
METASMLVHTAAREQLAVFLDATLTVDERVALVRTLRPTDDELGRLVVEPLRTPARRLYAELWQHPPPLSPKPHQTEVWVRTATTEDFVAWNERAREFPGGYRALARFLVAGVIWVAWKFVAPGESSGLSFDGLAWLDGRFVWLPQLWRMLPP